MPYRKGAIGITYPGSKKFYAPRYLDQVLKIVPSISKFYDVMAGGAGITFEALKRPEIKSVVYNDADSDIYELIDYLLHNAIPKDWYDWISRERFFELLTQSSSPKRTALTLCYSFGSNRKSYAYGTSVEPLKKLGHDYVVGLTDGDALSQQTGVKFPVLKSESINERRMEYRRFIAQKNQDYQTKLELQHLEQLQQLERLEHLQQLQHLERLEHLQQLHESVTPALELFNHDYQEFNPIDGVVFVDPPYKGTAQKGYESRVDYDELYAWFRALKVPAFMCEYNAPFECVWSQEVAQYASRGTQRKGSRRVEKLFWNGITGDNNA